MLLGLPLPHAASQGSRRETPLVFAKWEDECDRCSLSSPDLKAKSAKGKLFLAVTLPEGTLVFTNLGCPWWGLSRAPQSSWEGGAPPPPGALVFLVTASHKKFAGLRLQGGARPKEQSQTVCHH